MELKQSILAKAEQLFKKYGIKSVTMDDLARALGISKKTLYQHVPNKAELIHEILSNYTCSEKDALDQIRQQARDAVEEMLHIARFVVEMLRDMSDTVLYDLQKYYRQSWEMIQRLHKEHIYEVIRSNLVRGQQEGLYREDIDPSIIARLYVSKTLHVVDEDLFPKGQFRKEEVVRQHILYHIRGVSSEAGLRRLSLYLHAQTSKNQNES